MKTLIYLCVVMSIAAVTYGNMPDFGGMMKQASGMAGMIPGGDMMQKASGMAGMIPGMNGGGGDNPFSAMMKQMEGMVEQAGAPDKMINMMQEFMAKAPESAQATMGEYMQKMTALKDQGASPDQMLALISQMKKATGQ